MTTDVEEQVREEVEIKTPSMWRVIFHNDNKTTMEFVIFLLIKIFHKSDEDAVKVMMDVHEKGTGIAGVYTHEIAENKMHICLRTADSQNFPLLVTIEEEI